MKRISTMITLLVFSVMLLFAQSGNVRVIYGYLYVFPHEIGVFDAEPINVIQQLNAQSAFGYSSWRIPTTEELALIRANGYADAQADYFTSDRCHNGRVLLVTTKNEAEAKASRDRQNEEAARQKAFFATVKAQTGYIDLGLPSGIKWAAQDFDRGRKYNYAQAKGCGLPTKGQWKELKRECTWIWSDADNGFFIKGKNGNAIFLGATDGFLMRDGTPQFNRRKVGCYWSKSWEDMKGDDDLYWCFFFEGNLIGAEAQPDCYIPEIVRETYYLTVRGVRTY